MNKLREWLQPIVYLSNNWISMLGVIVTTSSAVLWLVLLPASTAGLINNPYLGILAYLLLPGIFMGGLLLIPLGMVLRRRRERGKGTYPADFPVLSWQNPGLRRLAYFVGATTVVNLVIAGQTTYQAVDYMDSVNFCGRTCHTVMQPEYTAYQNSPHARVECVKCHIGPGASWFVKSKLSGVWQVIAVTFNTYERPIPTPVENLRPARETCEACHWPQKYGEDKLKVLNSYGDDEANTRKRTVMLLRVGVIHRAHLRDGVEIRYSPKDKKRQEIEWIEFRQRGGRRTEYAAGGAKRPANEESLRLMDCVDCHNRPTHAYEVPERGIDRVLESGAMSAALPFAKKTGLEILKRAASGEAAEVEFENWYKQNQAALFAQKGGDIRHSAAALRSVYERNIFPEMKVSWGSYPNNLGHNDFPGCFRCHDDQHVSGDGKKVTQDCSACHNVLAMEEPAPTILTDLGVSEQK